MKIIFIRHGEPDKSHVDKRGFRGQGRDMAPLSPRGIEQANEVSKASILKGSQVIISSPYTRALQTAAIISKETGLDINVEVDLHEFIPDKTFRLLGEAENKSLHKDFILCKGEYPQGQERKWETITEIIERTKPVIDKYSDYEKIIVVAHGGVIRRYAGQGLIDHCEISEVDYDHEFECFNWV
jgi:broad specificity phosphatase PhoE